MLSDRSQRIISIMEDENMNATQFADTIGIKRASMSHLMIGRNKPSADVIAKVLERFHTINPQWLLSGKGSMRIKPGNESDSDDDGSRKTSIGEPDLFNQLGTRTPSSNSSAEENIRTEIYFTDEKNEGDEVKKPDNISKVIEKETVIYKERPTKTIDKLLIFYSDNTFDTFIPEKHDYHQQ